MNRTVRAATLPTLHAAVVACILVLLGACAADPPQYELIAGGADGRRMISLAANDEWLVYQWASPYGMVIKSTLVALNLPSGEAKTIAAPYYGALQALDRSRLVFQESPLATSAQQMFSYDLDTGQRRLLARNATLRPSVHGDTTAWAVDTDTPEAPSVMLATVDGRRLQQIESASFVEGDQILDVIVDGDRLIWMLANRITSEYRLQVHDIVSGETADTSIAFYERFEYDVSDARIAYRFPRHPDIHIYDIENARDEVAVTDDRMLSGPRIAGDYVIWTTHAPPGRRVPTVDGGRPTYRHFRGIHRCDLRTREIRELASGLFLLRQPCVTRAGTVYAIVQHDLRVGPGAISDVVRFR